MDANANAQYVKPFTTDLINLIYQAPLKPHLWQTVLNEVRILCGADQCTLFFYDALEPRYCLASAARIDDDALKLYLKYSIRQQAVQINNQLKSLPEGLVVTDYAIRDYVGSEYSEIVGEDYMNNFWPNLHLEAAVVLLRGENSCAGLGLQNFANSLPLHQQDISLLQELSPHLRQAMWLHQQITRVEHTKQALTNTLTAAKSGIILLDKQFTIKFINNNAKKSLEKIEPYSAISIPKLNFDRIDKDKIHNLIKSYDFTCKNNNKKLDSEGVRIDYKSGHLKVSGYHFKDTEDKHCPFLAHVPEAHHLLLIQDSNLACTINHDYLQSAYGITGAEHQLILALVNGNSLLENAKSQRVKPSTMRWHLKNILLKTHTHSQTELARLMIELRD